MKTTRGTKGSFTALLLSLLLVVNPAFAAEELKPHYSFFSTDLRKRPEKRRNLYLPPIASFLLPSFDQWWEEQHGAAVTYLGIAVTGASLYSNAANAMSESSTLDNDFKKYSDVKKQLAYGSQLMMFAGEMSAYHSFRTAMKSRQQDGQFTFLTTDEDPGDLLLAPFAFSEVLKPTTFVPLLLVSGLVAARLNDRGGGKLSLNDSAFVAGTSYNAGVGEEALFRGYLMPMFREGFGSDFWSNAATAVLFGAAHLSATNKAPLVQTAFGFYNGWLSQRNGWSLRQSIFLHAWWDVIALGGALAENNKVGYIGLPPLTFQF